MRNASLYTALLIATLAISAAGCSRSPVAPISDTSAGPGAGTTVMGEIPDDPPPADGGTPGMRQVTFAATDEGVVVVGRFTLWVRKNSLKMPATITLKVDDPEATECEITVSPAAANDFQSPVFLYANTSDIPEFDYDTGTFMEFKGNWQWATDASSHPTQPYVVGHFTSLYKVRVSSGDDKWKNKMAS
jgi:hypothetical protein